jgi:hypothetical protein
VLAPTKRDRWSFSFHADAALSTGASPQTLFGVPVMAEAAAPSGGRLSPSFHLGFERAGSGTTDVQSAAARFVWTAAIAEGCPHRFRFGRFALEPCARFEAGALEGIGERIVPARQDTRAWAAVGAVGRARWAFWDPLFVELEAGLRAPFFRTTYFFEPNDVIYRLPAIGGTMGAGLGARFL